MHTKKQLLVDLDLMYSKAIQKGYSLGERDVFALGYLCGKYDLTSMIDNQDAVIGACDKYDDTDDLMLFDTIGEVLIDLEVINNDDNIL